MFFVLFSVNVVMMLIMVRKSDSNYCLALLSSHWLRPKQFSQCLVPMFFDRSITCYFLTGWTLFLIPIALYSSITCYPLIGCSQNSSAIQIFFYSSIFSLDTAKIQIQLCVNTGGRWVWKLFEIRIFFHLVYAFKIGPIHWCSLCEIHVSLFGNSLQ